MITNQNKNIQVNKETPKVKKQSQLDVAINRLVYYMLKDKKILEEVEKKITFVPNDLMRSLVNKIIDYYHKYNTINIADIISYIADNNEELVALNEIINMNIKDDYTEEEINDYIKVINEYPVKNRINELNKMLKVETDPKKQIELLNEIMSLKGVKE